MPDIDAALKTIRYFLGQEQQLIQERKELMERQDLDRDLREEQDEFLAAQLKEREWRTLERFRQLLNTPPFHSRHDTPLEQFHGVADYEKSVFIMTKFPRIDPAERDAADDELTRVIEAVKTAIESTGYTPRIASDHAYHPQLWDNVELYLLGCSKGVAIVEDRYRSEMNPNVAMEWGWMRGMGRDVLYLVENGFENERADTTGFLRQQFSWDDPESGVQQAISAWLNPPNATPTGGS